RTPVIGTIAPGIGARLDGAEHVTPITIGQGTADTTEVGVQGSQVAVILVTVPAAGVGLPDLDQGIGHGLTVLIKHTTVNNDALTDRQRTGVEVQQQVVVVLDEEKVNEIRDGGIRDLMRNAHQRLARGAGDGGLVVGEVCLGMTTVTVTYNKTAFLI